MKFFIGFSLGILGDKSSTATMQVTLTQFTIISGGQTGAYRAALDWAICNSIPHGGYSARSPGRRWRDPGALPTTRTHGGELPGKPEGEEHRYSPPQVTDIKKIAVHGQPDLEKAGTSHVERQNLTIQIQMRRMTRLTNAFSKKFANLRYAYALHFFYYNFMRVHSTLRVTPAMESGLANSIWTWRDLLAVTQG